MSVSENSVPRFSLGRPWPDAAAIGGTLAVLNFITAPQDPGWLALNPSPWVLLPLLTGARFGFRWGFLSGALASLGLLATLLLTHRDAVAAHSLFFLALPSLGLLAGEAHGWFTLQSAAYQAVSGNLAAARPEAAPAPLPNVNIDVPANAVPTSPENPARKPAAATITGAAQDPATSTSTSTAAASIPVPIPLPLPVAAHAPASAHALANTPYPAPAPAPVPAPVLVPLEHQLRHLFTPGSGGVFPHLLRMLQGTCGVTDAALYQINVTLLTRSALLGGADSLPDSLSLAETGIAHVAVSRQSLVTCRQVLSTVPAQSSPWLAALPWPVSSGPSGYLLLIHRMDADSVNWRTFSRIQMICRWAAQFMELRRLDGHAEPTAAPLLVEPAVFRRTAADAAAAQREHGVPSTTVTFRPAPGAAPEHAPRLAALVAPRLRTTDLATRHPDGTLEVLLTFDGPEDAALFSQRITALAHRDPVLQNWLATDPGYPAPGARAAA